MRHDLRQEPYAVTLHVRICAGGGQQWPSLPRPCSVRDAGARNTDTNRRFRSCTPQFEPVTGPEPLSDLSPTARPAGPLIALT